jgi:serine/threonine protein kinase
MDAAAVWVAGRLMMAPEVDSSDLGNTSPEGRRFRAALHSGQVSRIEQFLQREPAAGSPARLAVLAAVEIRQRQDAGEVPTLGEYLVRFPAAAEVLKRELSPHFENLPTGDAGTWSDIQGDLPATMGLQTSQKLELPTTRFQMVRQVGRGAFGEVWEAFDTVLTRKVALKLLRRDRNFTQHDVASLIAEGQRLSALDHPNIVPIFDACFTPDGYAFLVAKFMPNGTLEDRLNIGTLSMPDAIEMLVEVCRGLQYAHEHEIVHRDVKPSNILFDVNDQPRIGDFGLATSERNPLSEVSGTAGTPAYMSPEQARGDSHLCGPRSDVYSFGVVLFRVLTGRLPFLGQNWEQCREQILRKEPPAPRSLNPNVPVALEELTLRCLRKSEVDRPATILEVMEDLQAWQRSTLPPPPAPALDRRHWLAWAAGGIAAVAAIGSGLAAFLSTSRPHASPATAPKLQPWQQPKVLTWNEPDPLKSYGLQGDAFHVDTQVVALFQVGEANLARLSLTLTAQWSHLKGSIGIFWGRDVVDEHHQRHWAVLLRSSSAPQTAVAEIFHLTSTPIPGTRFIDSRAPVASFPAQATGLGNCSVTVDLLNGAVAQITLNNQVLMTEPFSVARQTDYPPWGDIAGFGFVCLATELTVTDFQVA